jgi:hypothetical protein
MMSCRAGTANVNWGRANRGKALSFKAELKSPSPVYCNSLLCRANETYIFSTITLWLLVCAHFRQSPLRLAIYFIPRKLSKWLWSSNNIPLPCTIHHPLCNMFCQTVKDIDTSYVGLKRTHTTFILPKYHSAEPSRHVSSAQCISWGQVNNSVTALLICICDAINFRSCWPLCFMYVAHWLLHALLRRYRRNVNNFQAAS